MCPTTTTPMSAYEFFEDLYLRYNEPLTVYLFSMVRSLAEAREMAQDTFETLQRAYTPQTLIFPRAAIFKIATNFALMELRRRRMVMGYFGPRTELVEAVNVPDPSPSPDRQVMAEQVTQHIAEAIKQLAPTYRTVFVMSIVQGRPRREVAAELGITEKRLDKRITKALRHCREQLEARGVDLSALV